MSIERKLDTILKELKLLREEKNKELISEEEAAKLLGINKRTLINVRNTKFADAYVITKNNKRLYQKNKLFISK